LIAHFSTRIPDFTMSTVSRFALLPATGTTVSNLIVAQDVHEFMPQYSYRENGKLTDAVNLSNVSPAERSPEHHIYTGVNSFSFDPQGKKIIAFDVLPDNGRDFSTAEKNRCDVILYQKSATGQLFRLTPVSEKILKGVSHCMVEILNHPTHKLGEYSDAELLHLFAVSVEVGPEFNFEKMEALLSDPSFTGRTDSNNRPYSANLLGEYKAKLEGKKRGTYFQSPDFKSEVPQTQPGPSQQPPSPSQQPTMGQQQAPSPQTQAPQQQQPPSPSQQPIPMGQQPPQQPQKPDLTNFNPTFADIPAFPDYRYIVQWNVVFNKNDNTILGTMAGLTPEGGMDNARQEIFEYQRDWLVSKGIPVPPEIFILPNPTTQ